ncbi:ATP-dependent zinc metalloprotease FtsH [Bremerella alba]|uniref:ATP-dependent zinc metalloprotease FtsH n=1 Tax=Bremerella alba TaxID=980252 RepID=A0A7V8V9M5_9BACT|nr:ATP-dependent zinc metalloprotease FtsH [Bremerella alba]MBA2117279.1 ATP-dependent zinc metalloprotease FtsH [Bremerella alba]
MAENPRNEDQPNERPNGGGGMRPNFTVVALGVLLAAVVLMLISTADSPYTTLKTSEFEEQLKKGNVEKVVLGDMEARGELKVPLNVMEIKDGKEVVKEDSDNNPIKRPKAFRTRVASQDSPAFESLTKMLEEQKKKQPGLSWDYDNSSRAMQSIIWIVIMLLPLVFLFIIWNSFRRSRDQIMGGGFLSGFSKSPAKRYEATRKAITFKDVAGLEGVKSDLMEIVDFLRTPERFERLGGQIPKGVLLVGPPGTGKTLLARAIAGEAGVPFYAINGSEFIQMFVGVGASRVRDLFKTAKDNSPSIIFIDEIDAVGRQRGAGLGGGHDEREQTLNQILSEMDGFVQGETVIVVAATNRPDVLDPALLRPGRFDRHITVDRPTLKGRIEIFKVHVRDVPLADDVKLDRLAAGAVGLTGADIRNLINEAALWATRQDRDAVTMEDFEYARDKILMGARREEALVAREKEKTAYHEAGHALLSWLLPGVDRLHKVTVIPRGRALGVTQTLPEEDRMNISESELYDQLAFILGGRAAEKIAYNELSAGAENDLERVTRMARRMVTQWGMSERLGPVNYKITEEDPFLGREIHENRHFSEHTMQIIDDEVARILHEAHNKAIDVLTVNKDKLIKLTNALCEHEELSDREVEELIGPSVHRSKASKLNSEMEIASNGHISPAPEINTEFIKADESN